MATAAFTTLGCKVNQYETQRMLETFESAGFRIVPFDAPADVYVVNTCSVTSDAERKSRYTIRRASRTRPGAKIVVTGCAAQMASNRGESIDGADVVVPNPDKLRAIEWLVRAFPEYGRLPPRRVARPQLAGRARATLKIQDGCDVRCSYCSIPDTRPEMTSRPWHEVLEEAQRMAAMGYQEIVLTGVLIGSYGPATGSEGPNFEDLIEILATRSGVPRLRISSIEMRQVTPRLIALIRDGCAVPHLHIPLQSGDDQVLADMRRPYRQADYLELCDRLYRTVRDVSVTADVMVGFPTEDDRRFESSLHVAREARYLKVHVFSFSPRWGVEADRWGDPVPAEEKARRRQALAELAATTGERHARRFIGRTMRVVFEGKIGRDGLLEGVTDNFLTVKTTGGADLARQTAWVRLDEWVDGALHGEVVLQPSELTVVG